MAQERWAGAEDALKWVVNHRVDQAATTLPVSAIARLHRPDPLTLVLDQLGTARALGIAKVYAARVDGQRAAGSREKPGGVLHVLSVGINTFSNTPQRTPAMSQRRC
jgi:hypothetical protein